MRITCTKSSKGWVHALDRVSIRVGEEIGAKKRVFVSHLKILALTLPQRKRRRGFVAKGGHLRHTKLDANRLKFNEESFHSLRLEL